MDLPQLHPFRPRLLDALKGYDRARFIGDVGAGITVGIVALPLDTIRRAEFDTVLGTENIVGDLPAALARAAAA